MAVRFYFVPKIGAGTSADVYKTKYIEGAIAGRWYALDLGLEPWWLVCADVTAAEHTSISGQADVTTVPQNIDATLGANLAAVQAALEAMNIPAGWITSGMTYRQVLQWVTRLCAFLQRFNAVSTARFFASGLTLDNTVGDIPAAARQRITDVMTSFGLTTAGITLAMTVRAALKLLADQLPSPATILGQPL